MDQVNLDARGSGAGTILDIDVTNDRIAIDSNVFQLIAGDTLIEGASFILGSVAATAKATFLYDSGVLSFDSDGNGSATAEEIAVFSNQAALTADDCLII